MYEAVRNCSCLFLKRSTILDDLVHLWSWDAIDGTILRGALMVNLKRDLEQLHKTWNSHPTQLISHTFSFSKTKYSYMFDGLADANEKKTFKFNLFREDAVEFHSFRNFWFDVRVDDLSISLPGAVVPAGQSAVAITIEMGKLFSVYDENDVEHEFRLLEPRTTTFIYSTEGAEVGKQRLSEKPLDLMCEFNFSTKGSPAIQTFPLYSPFTEWKLTIDEGVINIKEVVIQFKLLVRTRAGD